MTMPPVPREQFQRTANVFVTVAYLLGGMFGCVFIWGGAHRFDRTAWEYLWTVPHAPLVWGVSAITICLLGLLSLITRKRLVTAMTCWMMSFWTFVLGAFLTVDVLAVPNTNMMWPPMLWFFSFCFTWVGLTYTTTGDR